jgi:glucan phosphoethanolaminetransferase (alkaline phosphatase superfamily)
MKYNILYTIIFSILFISLEFFFRIEYETLENITKTSNYVEIFLIFFLLSFLPKKIANISLTFLATMFIIEVLHFNYFGYFLFPTEFILLFQKFHEVLETGVTVLNVLILPIIFALIIALTAYFTNKLTKKRIIYNKLKYILYLIILIPIVNTGIHYKKRTLGERPNTNKSILKNELYVVKAFLGKTLPLTLLDIQTVQKYANDKFTKNTQTNNLDTIVLVIGESLSLHYMNLYGYDTKNTPNLLKLQKNDTHFIALKATSAGMYTDTSIPMIINAEKRPNAINHILSNETNLFKLAKENCFNTYFISAQAKDGFSYIRNYIGLKYIDKYVDSSNYGFDKYTSALDNILEKELEQIDFSQKNFIVLNMIGSHEPYEIRVPKDFKPFGSSNHLDNYNNTVAYTDSILNNIIQFIKEKNKKILFLFTSDHGQHVTKQSLGKGNLNDIRDYQVPVILYSHNFDINNSLIKRLKSTKLTSHYNMALLASYYLGYNTLKYIDTNRSFIDGNELSGNGGYIEYNLKTNEHTIK